MSTAGEAASLFGPLDNSSDPFGSAFEGVSTSPAGNVTFGDQEVSAAADFFDQTTTKSGGYLGGGDGLGDGVAGWSDASGPAVYDHYGGNPPAHNSQYVNGWGGSNEQQYGSWSGYGSHSTTSSNYGSYQTPSQNVSQQVYDPYAPATNTYGDAYAQHPAPKATTSAPYDPYAPVHKEVKPAISTVNSTYDVYSPPRAPASVLPAEMPKYEQPYSQTYSAPNPVIPVPLAVPDSNIPKPVPSASAYRPKTFSAYDPPLPPPKHPKRAHVMPMQSLAYPPPASPDIHSEIPPPPVLSPPPPPRGKILGHQTVSHRDPPNGHQFPPESRSPYMPAQPLHNRAQAPSPPLQPPQQPFASKAHQMQTEPSYATRGAISPQFGRSEPHPVNGFTTHNRAYEDNGNSQSIHPSTLYDGMPHTAGPRVFGHHQEGLVDDVPRPKSQPAELSAPFSTYDKDDDEFDPEAYNEDHVSTSIHGALPQVSSPYAPQTFEAQSSLYNPPAERTKSPTSSSTQSWMGTNGNAFGGVSPGIAVVPPPPKGRESPFKQAYDPPKAGHETPFGFHPNRAASPANYHRPARHTVLESDSDTAARNRSASNSSNLSTTSTSARDPYAPSLHPRQAPIPYPAVRPAVNHFTPESHPPQHLEARPQRSNSQVLSVGSRATHTPYAPSPSLLGTNDPLGRTSVRVPVVTFGFGGKFVTCFHGASSLNTGFDIALSSRQATDVTIRVLHQVIPQSALDTSTSTFPGPLFCDPGTPTTSLVRTGASSQVKTKKARVIKYLEELAEEISQGVSYLQLGSTEGRRAEARHILVMLLKVMVEHDGRLSGSPQIDSAVRSALVPQIPGTEGVSDPLKTAVSLGYPHPGELAAGLNNSGSYPLMASGSHDSVDFPISTHTLRASHLEKIHSLLVRGERRAAFQYAADEKLWAHAMVIASSIDKDAWKEVVGEFVRTELATKDTESLPSGGRIGKPASTGRHEPLRVAYSLFAGQGAAAVQELSPPQLLSKLQAPAQQLTTTPMTSSFPPPSKLTPISPDILAKWTDTAAMMISSPMTLETSSALTALGDQLSANGWVEAAHACYLLSPQTSPVGGFGPPTTRVVLFGATNPSDLPSSWKDMDSIIFTEIVEFALSLATPAKGQEAFPGLPHLQAYRLLRAFCLSEVGHNELALRYCEAITNSTAHTSPYIHKVLDDELRGLMDRLVAAPQMDKSGSWIASKMTRPSLDKLGGWIEGRLTRFIAGEGDSPQAEDVGVKERPFSGPFAHYSTISSTTNSVTASPQMSTVDLASTATPPYRSGSAMALRASGPAYAPINRASSAMDYVRRKASPVPRVSSANARTTTFTDPSSLRSLSLSEISPESTPRANRDISPIQPTGLDEEEEESSVQETPTGPQLGSWWGSSNSQVATPTASNFIHVETAVPLASDGFVSLMDDPALSVTPTASNPPRVMPSNSFSSTDEDGDDDDLGLGNSSNKKTQEANGNIQDGRQESEPVGAKQPAQLEKTADKPASSGGWLSRLWGRSASGGPVKASLGEETSFYYDKDLKRWVNKNAKSEDAKPSGLPPPPRAQTASPGTASARMHTGPSPAPPPPVRPATAIDLTNSPPRKPPVRVRSNLVPLDHSSAPSTPASATIPPSMDGPPLGNGPPLSGRPKAGVKRNVRSRYVDVFQQ